MTLTEQAIATIAAGCEGVTEGPWRLASDLPAYAIMALNADGSGGYRVVQTPNQNNYRYFGPSNPWNGISSYSDAAHIARLDPATVLALCALAQEALQSRREGQQMREATDQFVIDAAIAELARQRIVMDDFSDPLNVTALCSAIARALSHPKPESVK